MEESRRKILSMLSEGKISVDDAERLLSSLNVNQSPGLSKPIISGSTQSGTKPKFLIIQISDAHTGELANIRIPLGLIRAGMKLSAFMPNDAKEKISNSLRKKGFNVDFDNMQGDQIEALIEQIAEFEVNISAIDETVRIYCE